MIHQYILINNTKVAYHLIDNGFKDTVVFLHDSLGCITLWRDFPLALGELTNCNVLLYDRYGYGNSQELDTTEREVNYMEKEADFLHELLMKLNIKNPILFGHSDGGTIALHYAANYVNNCKAIITEGAHVFVEEITLKGIREAKVLWGNTNLKDKLTKYHGNNTNKVFFAWQNIWLTPKFREWNIVDQLNNIQCPALIIQGEKDEYGSLKQVNSIINAIGKKSESFIIPNIGHSPHKEAREITLNKSVQFINTYL